ncbi:UDP-2,3-diacylglucosamine diphosphatase [Oscillatoria amoena NRMC-F 0135]|nr:UDP-2,3-diacylglucosamine diphosphatase [Oscillatoria amoena NRMC-F 0135]
MAKRPLDICVVSDVHLGTYGCHAKELNKYLKKINPKILILNGDIIDIWQFNKRFWPESHMKVVQRIVKMINNGTQVHYLTGNHDEMLRRFADFELNNFKIDNKLVLEMDGKKMWFFHGDVFDITMKHSKWLAKLGGWGYDLLILLNRFVNFISENILRRGKVSLSKKIKSGVKQAIKFIDDFEHTAVEIAIESGYDYVACGHIHQPMMKEVVTEKGKVVYLNSGDWVENLTSLEYVNGEWRVFNFYKDMGFDKAEDALDKDEIDALIAPKIQHVYEDIIRHTGDR